MTRTMTSRERVARALNHEEPDRVPIDFGGTIVTTIGKVAHQQLKDYIGLGNQNEGAIMDPMQQMVRPDIRLGRRFNADCYCLLPRASSKWQLEIKEEENELVYEDEWGVKFRRSRNGLYFELKESPLESASLHGIEKFSWPDGSDPARVDGLEKEAERLFENTDYALIMEEPSGGIYLQAALLMGFQKYLTSLLTHEELVRRIFERILKFQQDFWRNALEKVGGYIQVVRLSDDLGSQCGPLISPELYQKVLKPFHHRLVTFIKERTDAKVFYHSCGSVRDFIPDLIEIGIDILNPVQVSAANMDTKKLKGDFGRELTFWGGGCDIHQVLPRGSVQEVRQEVRKRIKDLGQGGGFVFCPCHNIQADVPPENIVALFDEALNSGKYPL